MDMPEGRQRDAPHGALRHLGENPVAQLVEALRGDPRQAIGEDQPARDAASALRCGVTAIAFGRASRQLTSSAQPTKAAPHRNGLLRPKASNNAPAMIGPRTRDRLPTDCASPMTSPCSSAAARREIRLFNEGCIAPMPIDNPVTATISG